VVETELSSAGLPAARLAGLIWTELRPAIVQRVPAAASLPTDGLRSAEAPYLQSRAQVLATAPSISVVVPTRDPDKHIADCLDSIGRQEYPDFEIIVVDNASTTETLHRVLRDRVPRLPIHCLTEPRPGVSRARNAGARATGGQIVAFLDDDVIADQHWLAEVARGFRVAPDVAAVTGPILPVALDTSAQDWFEQAGGHVKGRGWTETVFDRASHARQHPLYPLPPFGATGNLAVNRTVLAELGGFDVALGPGTPTRGGEDMAFLCDLMLAGHTLVYRPGALVRHHHHAEVAQLVGQFLGYGTGLTAFYTRMVLKNPRHLATLARLAPRALRDVLGTGSARTAQMRADYPSELESIKRRGMLHGPAAYLRSRWAVRRDPVTAFIQEPTTEAAV
jgi:glycosyltransferase involved in cell wall biosynthesis